MKRETGNKDQKELNRTLSEAEQKRLDAFEAQSEKLKGQGYRRVDLTVSMGSFSVLFMGIIMTVSAAGDIMIVWCLLTYRSRADTIVYMDHPTQAGGVIFEK